MRIGADLAIILSISLIISFASFALAASPKLATEEVKALKEIENKLGKRDWNFTKDPCSGEGTWNISDDRKGFESSVSCDCSFNLNLTCHVVRIALKGQNLSGIVPPEFSNFRYLTHLDLSRNILNGTIPQQWATMKLTDLSLMGNRLSGPFPTVLTNITSLINMSIEGNRFSGPIPAEMGNMINLEKCILSSNAFSGTLPPELGKLVNLTDMRISDSNFSGKIPSFISKWTQIEKLQIHGSGLEGPIPSSISALTSLSDLRISDLRGEGSTFPRLRKMKSLKTLVLRNCLLHGELPGYLADFEKLKHLDLSFNKLMGHIPPTFIDLVKADFIYLTANQLTGSVPQWMLERNKVTDLSYNNFTAESSSQIECPRGSANLVESYVASKDKSVQSCLTQNFPCSASRSQQRYSLHIDCGGKELTASDNTTYEADLEPRGASMYYAAQNWAFSSTGNFMDDDNDADPYIRTNSSPITNASSLDARLYTTARVSPLSLTYYGLCLMNGNYTVRLHFAEIAFINDSTFNSLGRRIFDVYIQEKLVLKEFNIEKEAGGTGIPIVKTFNASVNSNTLKIHFYWAGKGTTGIPLRGVYGPLISAISVDPNFRPPTPKHKKTAAIVAGTASAAVVLVILFLLIMRKKGYLGGKVAQDKELRGLDLQTGIFTLKQLKTATKNFDAANKLGEGGFGVVYKGLLSDGTLIAVKQLSAKSKQGIREFVNEIGMISALQHPNLVKLYGCCVEGNQMMIIYEYMEKNSLSRALFGNDGVRTLKLDWATRQKICIGVARGLAYLHEESKIKIVHRDIKTSNVLLDKNLDAKISDFGLARLNEDDNTHISTRIAGTIGYMSPEYAMRGYLTDKADVYSFGVVALELVSGKSNTNYRPKEEFVYLLDWAYVLQERGSLLELVDPELGSEYSSEEAMVMLNVALLCTNASPTLRPIMSQVVSMLEGRTAVQDLLSDPGFSATTNPKFNAIRKHFWQTASLDKSMTANGHASIASITNSFDYTEDSEHLMNAVSVESND